MKTMRKLRATVLIFLPIAAWALIAGCANFNGGKHRQATHEKVLSSENASGEDTVLQETTVEEVPPAEQEKRFSDVPVPEGFQLKRSKSFVYEAGQIKTGLLTYTGSSSLKDVISFYKVEMLPYQWNLVSTLEFDGVSLDFEKPGWSCRVSIHSNTFRKTTLVIVIGPKQADQ